MASPPGVPEAFRLLQAGDVRGALEAAQRVIASDPANARAHLAAGIALRLGGRPEQARMALAQAQRLDPRDHAAVYESGLAAQAMGDAEAALEAFGRSASLRADFFAAHFAAGLLHAERREWPLAEARFRRVLELRPREAQAQLQLALVLAGDRRPGEAGAVFERALADHPGDADIARAYGQHQVSRGNYGRAAALFSQALRSQPRDAVLPMYIAQCELLEGRWAQGWAAYAAREPRRRFERSAASHGKTYAVPTLAALRGGAVTIVAEQGLGDTLFFLRWARRLRDAGTHLRFAGDTRLHPLLGRTGLFDALDEAPGDDASGVLLAGDLPQLFPEMDATSVASLRIDPLAERVGRWQNELEAAGPRPWIGLTWRAGTPPRDQPHALSKNVPFEAFLRAMGDLPGTLIAIQRAIRPGELDAARDAAGRGVQDLSRANEDLEDLLALVTLLDRHVAVSSTTLHLAAAAGAGADVLVPFPPEWRWRKEGDSPWFPGFRVHRQDRDGDWSSALAAAVRGQASGLQ